MPHRLKHTVWVLPLVFAGLVAVLGWWGNDRLRQTIQGQLKTQLKTTLDANVTALEIWASNQTRLATALTEDPALRTLANRILADAATVRRETPPPAELNEFINDLKPRLASLGYETAQLVNTNYVVVANSRRFHWGANVQVSEAHTNKFVELFASGQPVIITPFKPDLLLNRPASQNGSAAPRPNEFRRPARPGEEFAMRRRRGDVNLMQVAAPVRNESGGVAGALALIINPDKEFSRILSVARSGASAETYAFDQTGLMISRSRFDDQLKSLGLLEATNTSSALNLRLTDPGGDLTRGFHPTNTEAGARPLIWLAASAVDGREMVDVATVRDYRGVPVVGASRWLPQFGFGVATQMDAAEAYRPLHILQWVFVILFLSLLLCSTGMFVLSNLNWRRRLSEAELELKQLGQYTLEEKIGEGGMGVVYRARHALLRRDTAVKLLLPDRADPEAVVRFEKEVCLTCQLTHPNTIQVFDYGHTPDGIFYYAMEFLRGLNLHELVARYGPQPEGRVIHILSQVCDSLAEAHALGLIHRDIKPGNIFLCDRGGVPDCVKVLDFGLVQEFHAGHQEQMHPGGGHMVEGTPWFTPPEAIQGANQIDPRSDVYSLGALGYYLLTARYIFDAETVEEIHEKQLAAPPVPPRERTTQPVSPEMEEVLLRCLEKNPDARPQSVVELKMLLLACPPAAAWTVPLRAAWWAACRREPMMGLDGTDTANSTPMPTVKIDMAGREA
jgi:hypothetical protein